MKPESAFEKFKRLFPDTKYTEETFGAYQFPRRDLPKAVVGDKVHVSNYGNLIVTAVNNNWVFCKPTIED